MIFVIKYKSISLTHNVFLAIATNILQWFKTGFMVQGHKLNEKKKTTVYKQY